MRYVDCYLYDTEHDLYTETRSMMVMVCKAISKSKEFAATKKGCATDRLVATTRRDARTHACAPPGIPRLGHHVAVPDIVGFSPPLEHLFFAVKMSSVKQEDEFSCATAGKKRETAKKLLGVVHIASNWW